MNISISISVEEMEAIDHLLTRFFSPALQTRTVPEGPEAKPAKQKKETEQAPELDAPPVILEPGTVAWAVEIDGLPQPRWMLNYQQAHLPVVAGKQITYRGQSYRVSRIYGTTLKLTSTDADIYQTQGVDGLAERRQAV